MRLELDHLFVCTEPGAPEAEELIHFGLREGPSNTHPGQGTANRRFPFLNAMIELVWVAEPAEAQSPQTQRTQLWERWHGRNSGASPFGICVRPAGDGELGSAPQPGEPFSGWAYKPSYLPAQLSLYLGDAPVTEPMWVYMDFMRRSHREAHFAGHPAEVSEITGLVLHTPTPLESEASRVIVDGGILSTRPGENSLLEIEFDHRREARTQDFRPSLPLVFHY